MRNEINAENSQSGPERNKGWHNSPVGEGNPGLLALCRYVIDSIGGFNDKA
jgi:hypothetical protein